MEFAILPGSAFLQACCYGIAAAIVIAAGMLLKRAALNSGATAGAAAALQGRYSIGASSWLFVVSAASYSGALLPRDGSPVPSIVLAVTGVPRSLVRAWNVLGLMLLLNIVGVAILSTPVFAYFGRDRLNVWVMWMPYTLLPAVMVPAAWAGHLIIWRALSLRAASTPDPR